MLRWIREKFPAVFDCQVAWKIHQVLAAILSLELLQVSLSSSYDFKSKVVSISFTAILLQNNFSREINCKLTR